MPAILLNECSEPRNLIVRNNEAMIIAVLIKTNNKVLPITEANDGSDKASRDDDGNTFNEGK